MMIYEPTGDTGLLTRRQKWQLSELAAKAWDHAGRPGKLEDYRRDRSIRACGLRISEARQRDWAALRAEFQDAAGESGEAFETLVRDHDNARRIALYKLRESLRERRLPEAYAETICKRQYGCGLREAEASQLWKLNFTIRNRRKAVKEAA